MASKNNIHHDLAEIALEKVEGFAFERFAQDFYPFWKVVLSSLWAV